MNELSIKEMHTKQLIEKLRRLRSAEERTVKDPVPYRSQKTLAEIREEISEAKKELATRPHVPNKNESRELRIDRKKSGVSRKKKKSV